MKRIVLAKRQIATKATPRGKAASRDPARTASRILNAATQEFALHGYQGARTERIVAKARCNMRMLYHYYGSKEGLYLAVLESIYGNIREKERKLALDHLAPVEGIAALVDFTFTHFADNPAFVQITRNENLERGAHIARLQRVREMSSPLIGQIEALLRKGEAADLLRGGIDALQLYVSIVALSCHHLNNAFTLSATFGADLRAAAWRDQRRAHVRQLILSYVTNPGG